MRIAAAIAVGLLASCSLSVDFDSIRPGQSSSLCSGGSPDGILDGDEECDDGNTSDTDACLSSCRLATCGDGFVRAFIESCDDATDPSCSAECVTCPANADANAELRGRCYTLLEAPRRWGDARGACMDLGADLASLSAELSAVDATAELISDLEADLGASLSDSWFGVININLVQRWVDGAPGPASTNWEPGQTFEDSNQVGAVRAATGEWFLDDFTTMKPAICMRAPTSATRDPATGHYYQLYYRTLAEFGTGVNAAAEAVCDRMQGHLVTINSASELAFLNTTFSGQFRIGLRDTNGDGELDWITGEEVLPEILPGFASLPSGSCTELNGGMLADSPCGNNGRPLVCEWD